MYIPSKAIAAFFGVGMLILPSIERDSPRTDNLQDLVVECDVDNDQRDDVIAGELRFMSSHKIDLYLSRGGETFFNSREYIGTISTAPFQPRIRADDVNNDGLCDIVITRADVDPPYHYHSTFINQGKGKFLWGYDRLHSLRP